MITKDSLQFFDSQYNANEEKRHLLKCKLHLESSALIDENNPREEMRERLAHAAMCHIYGDIERKLQEIRYAAIVGPHNPCEANRIAEAFDEILRMCSGEPANEKAV